ncbi:Mob1/phocein [Polychaeton citri CBS 116435]|uniref:Mob1/phocein n=1 Tax=Polychaeton citri CBS 116435 TaxID=1314669 RepID=A0A9P4UM97_9PEZI|nr:Mob1/phocein [Polychaeton citri CBS 116435]
MAPSPSSSPRLPSPPPIAEDQTLPTSPGVSLFEDQQQLGHHINTGNVDANASRRIRPGTRSEDMAAGPPLIELSDIDSAFQLAEHLKALHHEYTHPPDGTVRPVTPGLAQELSRPPPGTSREMWRYELARFLIQKTNAIIVSLFADSPPCSANTCPEMRASEWQYLCAVHDPPKSCSAVDYCCHTLDWAANSLTSSKMFPSRLGMGSGSGVAPGGQSDKVLMQQMKEITNIFRRVYRIYAHAWFQHREMFWRVEAKTGLYIFFKTVCDEYGMIQQENYTIPSEAEGYEPPAGLDLEKKQEAPAPQILKREEGPSGDEAVGNHVIAGGETTKRHRHTRSDLSTTTANVIQEEEEPEEPAESRSDQPEVDSEPSLDQQASPWKDVDEEGEPSSEHIKDVTATSKSEEDEAPRPGVDRSNTMRPPSRDSETPAGDDNDDDDNTEITVIEREIEPKDEAEAEESAESQEKEPEHASIVTIEPVEAAAGDSEEAGKTVED